MLCGPIIKLVMFKTFFNKYLLSDKSQLFEVKLSKIKTNFY